MTTCIFVTKFNRRIGGAEKKNKGKNKMKKVILSVFGLIILAGCSGYDYYEADVRYYQDNEDCVYYFDEAGNHFDKEIRSLRDTKKIVYRNTNCKDLYLNDTFGVSRNDRKAVEQVFVEEKTASKLKCGCNKCGKKRVLKNRYVIVPSYED